MNIPFALQIENRWIVWKQEKRNGKFTKIPYNADTGECAQSNNPETWTSFEKASEVAKKGYNGIGFMLYGSKYIGIDFDGAVDDGVPEPYVLNILEQLKSPYAEITPSDTGIRAFVECPKLPIGNRKFNAKKKGIDKYGAEIYAGNEGGRYLTITGNRFSGEGVPKIHEKHMEIPYFLISKFADEHFRRLWMGDASEYENDESRVDLALLGLFMRAFNGDVEKSERFFNASVPGHREKWINRKDYRELTIQKAASGLSMSKAAWGKFVDQPRKIIEFQKTPPEEVKKTWTNFDYTICASEGQFDGWFPLGSPSLIGGSSGSGKTTFMLDLCDKQKNKSLFYGHETFGRKYLVLMLDRGKGSHERTMRRMGFKENQIPIKFLSACVDGDASQQIIRRIEEEEPVPELVFVEGMDMLVSDPNALEVVMPFMHEMQKIAEHFHLALVGSVGAPKTKPKEGYVAKRDTIFGSAVWSRMSETVVTMQYPNGDDTESRRIICVLPRNAKSERFDTEFQHGKLIISTIPIIVEEEKHPGGRPPDAVEEAKTFLENCLKDKPNGMARTVLVHMGREVGIASTTLDRAAELLNVTKSYMSGGKMIWSQCGVSRVMGSDIYV